MIKRGLYFSLLCLSIYHKGVAQDSTIRFIRGLRWSEVLTKAKQTGKFIFVDCYATWCGPCRLMDDKIYNAPEVSRFFNKTFLSVKMQMDTTSRDPDDVRSSYGDAYALRMRFEVNAYPTFLFFSPDGKIVHRGIGYRDTNGFEQLGKMALEPGEQYYTLLGKYKTFELSKDGEKKLALLAESLKEDSLAHGVANVCIRQLSEKELWTGENIDFMYEFTSTIRDTGFALFRDSARLISSVDRNMTKEVCEGVGIQIIYNDVIKPLERSLNGKPDWKAIYSDLKPYGALGEKSLQTYLPKIVFQAEVEPEMIKDPGWASVLRVIQRQQLGENEKFLVGRALILYENRLRAGDSSICRDFVEAFQYHCVQHPELTRAPQHNESAWTIFQHDNDKGDLNIALEWSRYSIDSVDRKDVLRAGYLDTYANLLYKLGRREEAVIWEKQAVTLNRNPRDEEFRETLVKMEAGQPTW